MRAARFGDRPRIGFKHVDIRDTHFIEEGSIRIRTLSAYRADFESDRKDPMEGTAHAWVKQLDTRAGLAAEHRESLRRASIVIDGYPGQIIMNNVHVVRQTIEHFVYCSSSEPNFELAKSAGQAIYRIRSLPDLKMMVQGASEGLLRRGRIDRVRYQPRIYDPVTSPEIENADVFVKGPDFAYEQEIRIAWEAGDLTRGHDIVLHVPGLDRLFKRIG